MKLKYTFDTIDTGSTIVAVPLDDDNKFSGMLNLNETGAFIMKLLKDEITLDGIVAAILAEYDGDEDTIRECVISFTDSLRSNGLLED